MIVPRFLEDLMGFSPDLRLREDPKGAWGLFSFGARVDVPAGAVGI